MRLFVALDIDDAIRKRIGRFLDDGREFAPALRWVRPESLHVTLKFIGERSEVEMVEIERTLEEIAAKAITLNVRGYGFFPGARRPRVFWVGIEATPELALLAAGVDEKVAELAIPKEKQAFSPHLTLAREAGGSASPRKQNNETPSRSFQRLQQKLAALPRPEFGTMTAREFFLYRSLLSPGGSRYTKLAGFALH